MCTVNDLRKKLEKNSRLKMILVSRGRVAKSSDVTYLPIVFQFRTILYMVQSSRNINPRIVAILT